MTQTAQFWMQIAAYSGVFLGVLLAFDGMWQLVSRSESGNDARNRRIRLIAKGASTEDLLRLINPLQQGGFLFRLPMLRSLPLALRQAGFKIGPHAILAICAVLGLLIAGICWFAVPHPAAPVAGFAVGMVIPLAVVRSRQASHNDQLARQLPDALDLMGRGLKVGHPLNATIASVANDMADPVAAEFGIMVDQIAYGTPLVDAFFEI
jgi:tight adherence protein B